MRAPLMKFLLAGALSLWSASAFADVIVTNLLARPATSVRLEGKSAERLFQQFNLLKWDGTSGARCHHPAYQIQVLEAGGAVSIDASICFHCQNVLFKTPAAYGLRGFDGAEKSAAALRESLAGLFKKDRAK